MEVCAFRVINPWCANLGCRGWCSRRARRVREQTKLCNLRSWLSDHCPCQGSHLRPPLRACWLSLSTTHGASVLRLSCEWCGRERIPVKRERTAARDPSERDILSKSRSGSHPIQMRTRHVCKIVPRVLPAATVAAAARHNGRCWPFNQQLLTTLIW